MKFTLFRMYKKREVIWVVSLAPFSVYLAFNRAKRIHDSLYCWVTKEKIVPLLKVKVNTVSIHQILLNWCDEEDLRFNRTHSWVFRSKKELLQFAIWRRKSNAIFSLGAFCTPVQRVLSFHDSEISLQEWHSIQFHRKYK